MVERQEEMLPTMSFAGHAGTPACADSKPGTLSGPAPVGTATAALPSRHLLIAGTGRAGTTMLVRYFDSFGLDTHLARHGDSMVPDDPANAGLEDCLLPDPAGLPYVVKSPWTYQFIEELLCSDKVHLDAVVVPLRNLVEMAASRSVIEQQAMHRGTPWLANLEQPWEEWSHTHGGTVYSVNPIDQARLLAVGLHRLLERLVAAEIPVILLAFPRLIEDSDYLFRMLAPVLPAGSTLEQARRIHAQVAHPGKVRVSRELAKMPQDTAPGPAFTGPSTAELERVALLRELARTRALLDQARNRWTWRPVRFLRLLARRAPLFLLRPTRRIARQFRALADESIR